MIWLAEALVAALILIGAFFLLVGSFGLAKLPGLMRRLHAPTKATTLGIGCLLLASMAHVPLMGGRVSFHELMITVFLFLTAPVTAHMIAKAHILRERQVQEELPSAGTNTGWATLHAANGGSAGGSGEAVR